MGRSLTVVSHKSSSADPGNSKCGWRRIFSEGGIDRLSGSGAVFQADSDPCLRGAIVFPAAADNTPAAQPRSASAWRLLPTCGSD